MEEKYYQSFCYSLAKAFSTGIRIYEDKECQYYYSVHHMYPDPVTPYLDSMMQNEHQTGVFTTPLYQFYGFLRLQENRIIILGPTKILKESPRELEELMFLLGVAGEEKEAYVQELKSAPLISVDRLAWLLSAIRIAIDKRECSVDEVWMLIKPERYFEEPPSEAVKIQTVENTERLESNQSMQHSYAWEQLMCSYVEEGKTDRLRDLFQAPPRMERGILAQDSLREARNSAISYTTIAARAAIRGGLDCRSAFQMSDLYIQKIEIMQSVLSIERLVREMLMDYAGQIEHIRWDGKNQSKLVTECRKYVAQNIYEVIRAENIADSMGYTRAYLCNQFKKQMGMTITQYVLREKVQEAKRILQFTDKSLCEIAALFSFSSQSHFQTVFKNITGETPLSYRERKGSSS